MTFLTATQEILHKRDRQLRGRRHRWRRHRGKNIPGREIGTCKGPGLGLLDMFSLDCSGGEKKAHKKVGVGRREWWEQGLSSEPMSARRKALVVKDRHQDGGAVRYSLVSRLSSEL